MFDFAKSTQMSRFSMLALSYEDAFERHVLGLFERQENELSAVGAGEFCVYRARIVLSGLRKGLKLRRHPDDLIGQAIECAKSGLISMLFLSNDPCSDAWDREHRDNAGRLRSNLLELHEKITTLIREETGPVIQSARLAYIELLDGLPGKVTTSQTNPEAALHHGRHL